MRFVKLLTGALSGAGAAIILGAICWFFAKQVGSQFGLPVPALGWVLMVAAVLGGPLGFLAAFSTQAEQALKVRANQEFAERHKLVFEENSAALDWPKSMITAVDDGRPRAFRQRCRGTFAGLPLDIVDIRFVEGSGDEISIREQTVFAWDLGEPSLPRFSIIARDAGGRIATSEMGKKTILGFDPQALADSEAELVREFNRRCAVLANTNSERQAEIRRMCVPEVMQVVLELGNLSLAAVEGRVVLWRYGVVAAGEQRAQEVIKTHQLLKLLVSARDDQHAVSLPARPNVSIASGRELLRSPASLPMGCAFGAAVPGFFVGVLLLIAVLLGSMRFLGVTPQQFGQVPPVVFPLVAFGTMLAFIRLGWIGGKFLERRSRRLAGNTGKHKPADCKSKPAKHP